MSANLQCEPRVLVHSQCSLGENPLWHPDHQSLYWCDIVFGRLYRHCLRSGRTEIVVDGGGAPHRQIGGFTLEADGALLLFLAGGCVERWNGAATECVLESRAGFAHTRFNDVIADPEGRVFCGTMPGAGKPGSLYRLDRDRSLTEVVSGIGCANGLAFTADRCSLYFTDSAAQMVYRFRYDERTGALSERYTYIDSQSQEGVPDGLTIDAEGNLWSARWEGSCIHVYSADGSRELRRVMLPVSRVTSLTFGGDDYASLFITTARTEHGETQGASGDVFMCRPGVTGRPEFRSRIAS